MATWQSKVKGCGNLRVWLNGSINLTVLVCEWMTHDIVVGHGMRVNVVVEWAWYVCEWACFGCGMRATGKCSIWGVGKG